MAPTLTDGDLVLLAGALLGGVVLLLTAGIVAGFLSQRAQANDSGKVIAQAVSEAVAVTLRAEVSRVTVPLSDIDRNDDTAPELPLLLPQYFMPPMGGMIAEGGAPHLAPPIAPTQYYAPREPDWREWQERPTAPAPQPKEPPAGMQPLPDMPEPPDFVRQAMEPVDPSDLGDTQPVLEAVTPGASAPSDGLDVRGLYVRDLTAWDLSRLAARPDRCFEAVDYARRLAGLVDLRQAQDAPAAEGVAEGAAEEVAQEVTIRVPRAVVEEMARYLSEWGYGVWHDLDTSMDPVLVGGEDDRQVIVKAWFKAAE